MDKINLTTVTYSIKSCQQITTLLEIDRIHMILESLQVLIIINF